MSRQDYKRKLVGSALFLGMSSASFAINIDPVLIINGFATAGASMTSATNVDFYDPVFKRKISAVPTIDDIGQNPTFTQDTLGGVQFIASINDSIDMVIQLYSQGADQYNVVTDWLYVGWQINDQWSLKAGRLRLPFFMKSEYYNVGYAYLWTRPPIEVYRFASLTDFDGLTLRYTNAIGAGWYTEDLISVGNSILNVSEGLVSDVPLKIQQGVLANATLWNDFIKFSVGYGVGSLAIDFPEEFSTIQSMLNNPCSYYGPALNPELITLTAGPVASTCIINTVSSYPLPIPASLRLVRPDNATAQLFTVKNVPAQIISLGYELDWRGIVSIAEWTRTTTNDMLIADSQGWYVTLGYNWQGITPYLTYSNFRTLDNEDRILSNTVSDTYANPFSYFNPLLPIPTPQTLQQSLNQFLALSNVAQSTINAGVRYDLMTATAIKFDYRYVIPQEGTQGFFSLPPGKRISWVTAVVNVVF